MTEASDVLIIGGGPAGAAAARLLATWGHRVLLVTKPDTGAPSLAESLPPSCRKLFAAIGLVDAIDAAGFYRTTGNTVWWGGRGRRSENFADDATGYQVLRRELDRVMIGQAEAAGATIVRATAKVQGSTFKVHSGFKGSERTETTVEYETAEGERGICAARYVLDCSGRAGVIARRSLRKPEPRQATLAIVGVWQKEDGWGLEEESHTLVEAYEDGWAWSVPTSPATRHVAVMVDPRVTDLERSKRVDAIYRAELQKAGELARVVAGATPVGSAWGCDASPYDATRYAGAGFLLVGDAASFIDPLSSYGVKKALASAWLAAIVTHTCLVRPEMEAAALELFSSREAEMYASCQRQAARHFQAVATLRQHPYWTGRAEPFDDPPSAGPSAGAPDVEALRRDPDVLAAFVALKRSREVRLRPTDALRVERGPGVFGREVVLEDRVVGGPFPAGVRFLRGVDLPQLVTIAGAHRQVPDLFEAYNRANRPVALPDFLGALSVLLGKELLVNESDGRQKDEKD